MDKEDARYQALEQLHERRKQVVRLQKRVTKIMKIADMTGLSYPAVRRTIDLYEQGGWAAIRPANRGRRAPRIATGASRLSGLCSRRVQFQSVVLPECAPRSKTSLLIGIAQVMAAERDVFVRGPDRKPTVRLPI